MSEPTHGAGAVTEATGREFWLTYDYQGAGKWCVTDHPPTVVRSFEDEVIHVREVVSALRPDEAAGQGDVVKAYLAENAKHGWTGRAFGFDGGGLNVDRKGNAEFVFDMDDLNPYYEEGKSLMLAKVPASEIEALRDYFVAAFPTTPCSEAPVAPDIVEREVAWLIERKWPLGSIAGATEPRWYAENASGDHSWTRHPGEAKRFSTKAEAEAFPSYQMIAGDPAISITEHVWINDATPDPDALAALRAELAEVKRERDEWRIAFESKVDSNVRRVWKALCDEAIKQRNEAVVRAEAAEAEVARLTNDQKYKRGDTVRCEYDGFVGTILAPYETREGRKGWVVQMLSTKVVHVYGEDRLLLVQPLTKRGPLVDENCYCGGVKGKYHTFGCPEVKAEEDAMLDKQG